MIYGYCRISTNKQNIERQIRVTIQSPENLYKCTKEKIRHLIESKRVKK